jgi:hypothetical protein
MALHPPFLLEFLCQRQTSLSGKPAWTSRSRNRGIPGNNFAPSLGSDPLSVVRRLEEPGFSGLLSKNEVGLDILPRVDPPMSTFPASTYRRANVGL